MTNIDSADLAGVLGAGTSTTTTVLPGYRSESRETDYKKCVATVLEQAPKEVPSTASPWNPFATDANAGSRDRNTVGRIRTTCGPPPG
jgi:hypothetical protein